MALEIERKFLLAEWPERLDACHREEVRQGYLALENSGGEVRVRQIGRRALLTVKRGRGQTRLETEIEITPEQFAALWPLTETRRVRKVRHYVPLESATIEVDVYAGELEGLITGEIEFASERHCAAFRPPDWIGEEVTGDPRYSNAALATQGMPPHTRR